MPVSPITRDELAARLSQVTLVEALPAMYYDAGHLPGALRIDFEQVDEQAAGLLPDKDAEIVVYCANAACKNSGIAAGRLVKLGYTNVCKYAEGKDDWTAAGLPVETSAVATA